MPKAKVKRKGAVVPLFDSPSEPKRSRAHKSVDRTVPADQVTDVQVDKSLGTTVSKGQLSCDNTGSPTPSTSRCPPPGPSSRVPCPYPSPSSTVPCSSCSRLNPSTTSTSPSDRQSMTDLPEEILWMILVKLDLSAVAAVEATCKRMRNIFINARIWRRIFLHKLEYEPGLEAFHAGQIPDNFTTSEMEHIRFKKLFAETRTKLHHAWESTKAPSFHRSRSIFGVEEEGLSILQIVTSGRYLAAFYSPVQNKKEANNATNNSYIHVYDRSTGERVKVLGQVPSKPDTFRFIDELRLVLLSYPSQLEVEIISLEKDETKKISLIRPGETESGSVCNIVVREHVFLRGVNHRWVVMVAMNTKPIDNEQLHIGEIQFYSLNRKGEPGAGPLARFQFHPLQHPEGNVFNQCIQKKGLSDFNEDYTVVVLGGCEGSSVLGVISHQENRMTHKLQLKAPTSSSSSEQEVDGCEGGRCQYSVVSLMIDRRDTSTCSVLLSTGQLVVIDLATGKTIFHRHLRYDGQLKLAVHQPNLAEDQVIAIKFRNYITFYRLTVNRSPCDECGRPTSGSGSRRDISLTKMRTITSVDAQGRETRCDDNPTAELRRQFGELSRSLRALNHYTSGIQRKLSKGLRPGTVTQGVMSMTKKVQNVTSKLDQAHYKAKEIESVVIDSLAFDNRYCHALTLTRDLVTFDLAGCLDKSDVTASSSSSNSSNSHSNSSSSSSNSHSNSNSSSSSNSSSKVTVRGKQDSS